MIPIYQDRFGDEGNCHAACIASILEVPLESVPSPTREELASADEWGVYLRRLSQEFLHPRNLEALCFAVTASDTGEVWVPPGYAILSLRTPESEVGHAIVTFCGEFAWNPHPLPRQNPGAASHWTVFIVLDPARPLNQL